MLPLTAITTAPLDSEALVKALDISGIGAVWDFTQLVQGGSLAPNAVSGERTLVFELRGLRPIGPGKTFLYGWPLPSGLLHFEGQVLGSTHKTRAQP